MIKRDNLKNELDFLEGKNRHLRTQNQCLIEKVSKLIREKQALERHIGLTASEKYEFLQEATKEFSLEKDKLVTDNDRLYGMVLSESQMVEKFEEQADSFETCYLRERMKVQYLEEQLQEVQDGRKKVNNSCASRLIIMFINNFRMVKFGCRNPQRYM